MQFSGKTILKINDVDFSYDRHKILDKISLEIKEGEIAGLIGENGAGKSTLMKILCGLREKNYGNIETSCERIGALIEEPAVYPKMTVKANMAFFRKLYSASQEEMLEVMSLTGINKFEDKKAGKLSVGMKKRLGFAIALLSSDKLILLDEPTSGLDPQGIRDTLKLISDYAHKKKIAFLVSSHIFQDLEAVCDTYYRLKDSKLTNIYDEHSYGYYLEKEGFTCSQLEELLQNMNCPHLKIKGKVLVKGKDLTEDMLEELRKIQITCQRRNLSEVYFE